MRRWEKILVSLAGLLCVLLFIVSVSTIVMTYLEYPIGTQVLIREQESLALPNLTVCPTPPFGTSLGYYSWSSDRGTLADEHKLAMLASQPGPYDDVFGNEVAQWSGTRQTDAENNLTERLNTNHGKLHYPILASCREANDGDMDVKCDLPTTFVSTSHGACAVIDLSRVRPDASFQGVGTSSAFSVHLSLPASAMAEGALVFFTGGFGYFPQEAGTVVNVRGTHIGLKFSQYKRLVAPYAREPAYTGEEFSFSSSAAQKALDRNSGQLSDCEAKCATLAVYTKCECILPYARGVFSRETLNQLTGSSIWTTAVCGVNASVTCVPDALAAFDEQNGNGTEMSLKRRCVAECRRRQSSSPMQEVRADPVMVTKGSSAWRSSAIRFSVYAVTMELTEYEEFAAFPVTHALGAIAFAILWSSFLFGLIFCCVQFWKENCSGAALH